MMSGIFLLPLKLHTFLISAFGISLSLNISKRVIIKGMRKKVKYRDKE